MSAPLKPEPSGTTLGRAAAKGTDQEWTKPNTSPAYLAEKVASVGFLSPELQRLSPHDVQNGAPVTIRRSPHR